MQNARDSLNLYTCMKLNYMRLRPACNAIPRVVGQGEKRAALQKKELSDGSLVRSLEHMTARFKNIPTFSAPNSIPAPFAAALLFKREEIENHR